MASPLFRQEAVEARARANFGRPAADLPRAWTAISVTLSLLAIGCLVFALAGNISRKETVRGRLVSVTREARVFSATAGIATTINVAQGQRVRTGDVLVVVNTERSLADGLDATGAILAGVEAEAAALSDQLQRLDQEYALREADRREALRTLELEAAADPSRIESARDRLAIAAQRLDVAKVLAADGWMPLDESRRREEAVISAEQDLSEKLLAQARRTTERTRVQIALQQVTIERENRRAELTIALTRIGEQRVNAGYSQGFSVRAPISGVISALQVTSGDRVGPDRPLLVIAPGTGELEVEVFIPSRAIGFIEAGDPVRIMFDAFPYQRFGFGTGTVRSITDTVLAPNEADPTVQLQEPVYRAFISLQDQTMDAYGGAAGLQTGMTLQADIILEERSFLAWVLDPLISARGRM